MNLDVHISELLYRFPCVNVPGFGAFITENVPAQILGSATSFIPPRKNITFNAHIKNNDGLLVNHVSSFYGISFEKATEKIENAVKNWLLQLDKNESITLEKIGVFSPSLHTRFIFTPNDEVNYLMASFGLKSFITPEISRVVQEVVTTTIPEIKTVSEIENEVTIVPIKKYEYQAPNHNYLKYAAAVALFCSVGFFGYKFYFDKQIEQQTLYVQKEVQKKVTNKIQNATFAIDFEMPKITVLETEVIKPYHLIYGVFRNPKNAEKALEEIQQNGFEGKVLPVNNHNLIPVAYGSYATEDDATIVKNEINRTSNTEAWILID